MICLESREERRVVQYDTHRRGEREAECWIIDEGEWREYEEYIANQEQYRQARHPRTVLYGEEGEQSHDRRAHDRDIPPDERTIEEDEYDDHTDAISPRECAISQYPRE